jgi:hypothetical protein
LGDLFVGASVDFLIFVVFLAGFGLTVVFGFEPGSNITVRLSSALSAGVPLYIQTGILNDISDDLLKRWVVKN